MLGGSVAFGKKYKFSAHLTKNNHTSTLEARAWHPRGGRKGKSKDHKVQIF